MIDNAGGVRIPGSLEVDGTLRVGGSSNLAGIKRILVAAVSQSGSTYTLKSSSYGFQSNPVRTSDGTGVHVQLAVASGITLDASNTLCLVSLCDNGSGRTGNIYDNSISCAFNATAGTVTVTLWSNNVSQTKMADGSQSQDDFSAVTAVGAAEDSPFSLMVIQLG